MNDLFAANTPAAFWRPLAAVPADAWDEALLAMAADLPAGIGDQPGAAGEVVRAVLSESAFGDARYRLSRLKSVYYTYARPLLPSWVRPLLRKIYQPGAERSAVLRWPIEDRFVTFQLALVGQLLKVMDWHSIDIRGLWPEGKQAALVLTHDVEAQAGHDFVRAVMDVEERHGFRSSFNFVPEAYAVDPDLLDEMRQRGFEVGVHGLSHDGRLFSSPDVFERRVAKINAYLSAWGAHGFRAPMTHRQPEWMQALDVSYDLSFFDTDPYEPMPGGTMSIWPFFIGRFVELPYTLMQDHTYLEVLEERSPALWLMKADYVAAHHGMVLLNSHPDYLLKPGALDVYDAFLAAMRERDHVWYALPRDVAEWWRQRAMARPEPAAAAGSQPRHPVWRLEKRDGRVAVRVPPEA